MIIDDFNVVCIRVAPRKTDAVLIVDANTILSATSTFQRLKTIPRKDRQITELICGVQLFELPLSYSLNLLKSTTAQAIEYCLGFFVSKRTDHNSILKPRGVFHLEQLFFFRRPNPAFILVL